MIEVRPTRDAAEVDAALALRYRVFCDEQGVAFEAEQDGRDPEALQLVAFEDARLVGTCRLLFEDGVARLGRMAVEIEARGRGLGAALLAAGVEEAWRAGARKIRLHAQTSARSLYERAGFTAEGDEFIEAGIPHVTMEKPVA